MMRGVVVKVGRGRTAGREVGAASQNVVGTEMRTSEEEERRRSERGEEDGGGGTTRERKEGVRVRGGGAIRNYCGTIDKRRLRGRTTEDSLRPSDFPLFHVVSLFCLSSLFPTSAPSWTYAPASCRALPTKPSRLVNM